MTVLQSSCFVRHVIADGAASKPFDFPVDPAERGEDVRVRWITALDPDPDWMEFGVDFTVQLAVPGPGGTVSFTPALTGAGVAEIERRTRRTQIRRFTNIGRFPEEAVEGGLDLAMLALQEVEELAGRALVLPRGSLFEPLIFGAAAAGDVIRVNADGDGLEWQSGAEIDALAGLADELAALGAVAASIPVVAAIDDAVSTVANVAGAVSALGPYAAAIGTCAANITAINGAAAAAIAAALSETNAATSEAGALAYRNTASDHADDASAAKSAAEEAQAAAEAARDDAEDAASSVQQALSGSVFQFDTGTADADPGAGKIRFNHASFGSVTQIYVSETDALGAAIGAVLDSWDDSTSSNRAYVIIRKRDNPVNFIAVYITAIQVDGGAYRKFTVSYSGHAGSFNAADWLGVIVERTGDVGLPGAGTGDVLAANAGSEYGGVAATFRGHVSAAPRSPEYLVGASNSELSSERVVTDTATISWDLTAAGQVKVNVVAGSIGATQLAANAVQTSKVGDNQITLAKIEQIATARLLGRNTASTGNVEVLAPATVRALLDLEPGTDFLAYSAFSANGISLVGAANYAAMRALLDLEAGTDFYSKSAADTLLAAKVSSDPVGVTGADQVTNIISLTTAEYAAIGTKNASTIYIITDA